MKTAGFMGGIVVGWTHQALRIFAGGIGRPR